MDPESVVGSVKITFKSVVDCNKIVFATSVVYVPVVPPDPSPNKTVLVLIMVAVSGFDSRLFG